MFIRQLFLVAAGMALVGSTSLAAHHSWAVEFDADRPVRLEGIVTKMDWINPHPWIYVEVKGEDGTPQVWMIQTSAPNSLIRAGFKRDSLPPGTAIVVEGFQARDGALRANGREVTFADGRKLFLSPGDRP